MKVLIVYAHPEPKSFNHALLETAVDVFTKNGHEVKVSDLYAMRFDPVSDRRNFITTKDTDFFSQASEETYATEHHGFAADVEAEIEKLEWCDALIFQFPLYWYSFPAIMKGWIDRVFAHSRVFDHTFWFSNGRKKGKMALISFTTGGGAASYGINGLHGEMNQNFLYAMYNCFRFIGFDVIPAFIAYSAGRVSDEQRKLFLQQYRERLLAIETTEPIKYPDLSEFEPRHLTRNVPTK